MDPRPDRSGLARAVAGGRGRSRRSERVSNSRSTAAIAAAARGWGEPESDIVIPDFEIPGHWPRAFGMDVAWNRTAVVWGALNRDTDVLYLYSEHYQGEAEPSVHADAIKARGAWIRGAIDPASRGRSQVDGRQLWQMYTDLGLKLNTADNAVEAGIYRVWQRLSAGRLKVFKSLSQWFAEFRLYRRDEKGKVVKERDHGLDATRYLCMELLNICRTEPPKESLEWPFNRGFRGGFGHGGTWMG